MKSRRRRALLPQQRAGGSAQRPEPLLLLLLLLPGCLLALALGRTDDLEAKHSKLGVTKWIYHNLWHQMNLRPWPPALPCFPFPRGLVQPAPCALLSAPGIYLHCHQHFVVGGAEVVTLGQEHLPKGTFSQLPLQNDVSPLNVLDICWREGRKRERSEGRMNRG